MLHSSLKKLPYGGSVELVKFMKCLQGFHLATYVKNIEPQTDIPGKIRSEGKMKLDSVAPVCEGTTLAD
jgi:hypothetical protein